MAHQTLDRVCETTTTTGTGNVTLAGAVAGFRSFSGASVANNDTCYYCIEGVDANGVPTGEWECGIGTYVSAMPALARTTVTSSSNAGAAVNLSAGTKRVFIGDIAGGFKYVGITTLLAAAQAGMLERDANCLYFTTDAGNRGVVPVQHIIRADSTRTLANSVSAQAIFNSPANGQITLETGAYEFEALIALTSMSGTSGNATFDFGGTATMAAWLWHGFGRDVAADGATGTLSGSYSVDATLVAAPLVTAATATAAMFKLEGTFEVTAGGTCIPRIILQTANAAIVSIGSYFKIARIGSTSLASVGQWD